VTAVNYGHAVTPFYLYESGTVVCNSGCSNTAWSTGVQSQVAIYNQTLGNTNDAIFHVISLDTGSGSTHYWLQTGYAFGTLYTNCVTSGSPCGVPVFYSHPQYFIEYNITGTYSSQTLGDAPWSLDPNGNWHTFLISLSGNTGYIAIDGSNKVTLANAFSSGQPSQFTEVHQPTTTAYVQSASGCPPCYGLAYWRNSQYQQNSAWNLFPGTNCANNFCYCSVICPAVTSVAPYIAGYVAGPSANSQVVSYGQTGGGGCGCRRE